VASRALRCRVRRVWASPPVAATGSCRWLAAQPVRVWPCSAAGERFPEGRCQAEFSVAKGVHEPRSGPAARRRQLRWEESAGAAAHQTLARRAAEFRFQEAMDRQRGASHPWPAGDPVRVPRPTPTRRWVGMRARWRFAEALSQGQFVSGLARPPRKVRWVRLLLRAAPLRSWSLSNPRVPLAAAAARAPLRLAVGRRRPSCA